MEVLINMQNCQNSIVLDHHSLVLSNFYCHFFSRLLVCPHISDFDWFVSHSTLSFLTLFLNEYIDTFISLDQQILVSLFYLHYFNRELINQYLLLINFIFSWSKPRFLLCSPGSTDPSLILSLVKKSDNRLVAYRLGFLNFAATSCKRFYPTNCLENKIIIFHFQLQQFYTVILMFLK